MKLTRVTLCALMLIIGTQATAYAWEWKADPWTKRQMLMQGLTTCSYVIDWGQTLNITDRYDEGYFEKSNSLLGENPSRGEVNTYFASLIVTHLLITHVLPSKYREPWLIGTFAISVSMVHNNYSIGLHCKF